MWALTDEVSQARIYGFRYHLSSQIAENLKQKF
jgi:hypothetical protein